MRNCAQRWGPVCAACGPNGWSWVRIDEDIAHLDEIRRDHICRGEAKQVARDELKVAVADAHLGCAVRVRGANATG